MKKFIFLVVGLLIGFSLNQNLRSQNMSKKFAINGFVKGVPDSTLFYLITDDENGNADSVSAWSHNEHFIFNGIWPNVGKLYFVKMDTTILKLEGDRDSYVVLIVDNSTINISGTLFQWPEVNIEGSAATNDYINYLKEKKIPYQKLMDSYNSTETDSIGRVFARSRYNQFINSYLKDHLDSYYAPLLTLNAESVLGLDQMEVLYSKMSKKVREGFYGCKLKNQIAFLSKREKRTSSKEMAGRGTKIGELAPEIAGYTPDRAQLSLSQIVSKGKVTLLDFWASWCVPCRAALPGIQEVYSKYHEKGFNVVSVSIDKDLNAWKKALKEEKLPWYNLSDMDENKNSMSKNIYNVNYIPLTFLLDNNGRIVATSLDREELMREVGKFLD